MLKILIHEVSISSCVNKMISIIKYRLISWIIDMSLQILSVYCPEHCICGNRIKIIFSPSVRQYTIIRHVFFEKNITKN